MLACKDADLPTLLGWLTLVLDLGDTATTVDIFTSARHPAVALSGWRQHLEEVGFIDDFDVVASSGHLNSLAHL